MADIKNRKTQAISWDSHKDNSHTRDAAPVQDNAANQDAQFRKIPMAELIRTYRKKARISQQDLGEMLGVTRNTVVNWEGGKYRPDIDLLLPLCDIFGITLYELFGTEDLSLEISSHENDLLKQYRQISPLSQRIVDRMVDCILYEESEDRNCRLARHARLVGILEVAAAAGDGLGFSDIPMESCRFVFINDVNRKADAVLAIKGDSMMPRYHSGDMVYVQFTQSPNVGEDVICRSKEGFHIKRLGEDGPYSLNPDIPFTLTSPDDHVETIGRVLGIVNSSADFPTEEEGDLLRELRYEDIEEFREKYHLTES
ncbi:MAG: XRE family transcriptional regulator [Lachnospiraceae bacterium]|nr:XRE family transcriptional regulator [Lachnospiraceae bacterium]